MINIEDYTPLHKGRHDTFVSAENRCEHIGHNPSKYKARQFKIDGGVFRAGSGGDRCDYLLLNDSCSRAYFIELKGSDIPKAIAQIEATISEIKPSISKYSVFPRIIYWTGSHKVKDQSVVKWKTKYGRAAVIKERKYEENI